MGIADSGVLNGFALEVAGDVQMRRRLESIEGRIEDASPLWRNLIKYLIRAEVRQFNSEGQTGSGGWAKLAERTIASKRARGVAEPERIMVDSGDLREAFTTLHGGAHGIRMVEPLFMVFGVEGGEDGIPYVATQQHGDPERGIPQRRVLELTEGQRKTIAKRVQRYLLTGEVKV